MLVSVSVAQHSPELYSRARIYFNQPKDLFLLAAQGVTVDHGIQKKGVFIESDFSANDLAIAQRLGMKTEILIEDVATHYANQNEKSVADKNASCTGAPTNYPVPQNFNLGSMGGYLTYQEFLDNVDSMVAKYPNIISARAPISNFQTLGGREIYWLKISDNPNVNEPEPQILYTALHHAREPLSLTQLIYYMWYLLENYATDPDVQALVNNTEMYFVPMLNPDGYIHNETTNPNGGGMWRKNRRNHGNGDFGVDLNRNYAYQWGTTGISFNTSSDVYCGTAPFTEVETQAIKWLCENKNFTIALNYHTYGNLLLYPFGYDNVQTPEHSLFEQMSALMVEQNGFANILSAGLYPASGDSDDWMYADVSTKPKIYAMTPEVGPNSLGFWPPVNQITPISQSQVHQNITAARLIMNYAKAGDLMPEIIASNSGHIKFDLTRLGLGGNGNFTVTVSGVNGSLASVGGPISFSGMTLLQTETDSVAYTLNAAINSGQSFQYVITVNNGLYSLSDTLTKTYGAPQVIFADDGSSMANWTSANWNTTTSSFYSAPSSITDSPTGNYPNNANRSIVLTNPVSLLNAVAANVTFFARWNIEDNYDFVQFSVSVDGGTTWVPQCGKYTNPGSGNNPQPAGEPLYDGIQLSWVKEEISLSDYLGQDVLFRFRLRSDFAVTADGFYFDDFTVNVVYPSPSSVEEFSTITLAQNMPNPARDYTFINYNLGQEQSARLEVYDAYGKLVANERLDASAKTHRLQVNHLAMGVYSYRIVTATTVSHGKKLMVVK
jgi:carboxypeptidase T